MAISHSNTNNFHSSATFYQLLQILPFLSFSVVLLSEYRQELLPTHTMYACFITLETAHVLTSFKVFSAELRRNSKELIGSSRVFQSYLISLPTKALDPHGLLDNQSGPPPLFFPPPENLARSHTMIPLLCLLVSTSISQDYVLRALPLETKQS